ncbi:MFS transporter [Micromonospora sp. NBC_01699]|uniref:MFS transporter n=1 Tax=Micromonospora sp. NBC_01699 TaxID=2975984 RepID=UPI002E378FFD|nr:MFS transporter [Micromonospora sp. NBC_01699]
MRAKVPYLALLVADTLSTLGSRISLLAIPWLVFVTTGSPTKMGIAAAAEMLPYVVTGVFAAPLADRIGLRRTIIIANVGSMLAMAAIAAWSELDYLVLLALVAIAGGLRGIGDRSKNAINRPIAKAAGIPIVRMTALYEGFTRAAGLVGAPLGGVLIYWLGAAGAIWIDAATFGICALLIIIWVKPPPPEPVPPNADGTPATPPAKEPYFVALRGGFAHLVTDRLLFALVLMTTVTNLFTQAAAGVWIPLWVNDVLKSPAALGLVAGAFAAGATLGSIGFVLVATKVPRYATFVIGLIIGSAPRFIVMGLSHDLTLVLVVTFLAGLSMSAVNPIIGALMYERVPMALQTRVFGLAAALSFIGIPLGGLLGGWSVDWLGLTPAILTGSVIFLAISLVPLLFREGWRGIAAPAKDPDAPATPVPDAAATQAAPQPAATGPR